MSKRVNQNIWLLCPHKQKNVPGYYESDNAGRYLVDQHGKYVIERTYCFEGRNCIYSNCVLSSNHRLGANGDFPSKIIPMGN